MNKQKNKSLIFTIAAISIAAIVMISAIDSELINLNSQIFNLEVEAAISKFDTSCLSDYIAAKATFPDMTEIENISDTIIPEITSYDISNIDDEVEYMDTRACDKNITKLSRITDYGSKIASEYITIPENKAYTTAVLYRIKLLSDEICKNCKSDTDKAETIALWVSENIYYDNDAAKTNVNLAVISLERTLSLRRTTCAGYSNLFSALCEAQGIYCVNFRGGSASSDYTAKNFFDNAPTNHEWNGVIIDNKWYFIDATWASTNGYINQRYITGDDIKTRYIMMNFENMSAERRIDLADRRSFFEIIKETEG